MRFSRHSKTHRRANTRFAFGVAGWVAGLLLVVGCESRRLSEAVYGPSFSPKNVHRSSDQLAGELRRVAVLPVTCDLAQGDAEAGRELLQTILAEELGKTRKCELINVSPDKLRQYTGRKSWTGEEQLPANFFKTLRDELGCDAVLFCRVTQFQAYPPLAVGLSLKLVEAETAKLLWAVDEVFDAGEPTVVNAARRYQQAREPLPAALADSRVILISPRGFSRYAASSLLATLPER